jgi:hypothetical protein
MNSRKNISPTEVIAQVMFAFINNLFQWQREVTQRDDKLIQHVLRLAQNQSSSS